MRIKRYKNLCLIVIAMILCTQSVVLAEPEPTYDDTKYTYEAVIARNPSIHGQFIHFYGLLGRTGDEYYLYQSMSMRDYYLDRRENAVYLDPSVVKEEWKDIEEYMRVSVVAYVNYNNRGPGGRYAATLQATKPEALTGEQVEEPPLKQTGTKEDPIRISSYQLLINPWVYDGKYIRMQARGNFRTEIRGELIQEDFHIENYDSLDHVLIYADVMNQDTVVTNATADLIERTAHHYDRNVNAEIVGKFNIVPEADDKYQITELLELNIHERNVQELNALEIEGGATK